jgi:hypothetical protein
MVSGNVIITHSGPMSHQGISLKVEGAAKLQLSARSVGLIEAIYNSVKPYELLQYEIPIAAPGKVPDGRTEIPFEFKLEGFQGRQLHETYHGVYVNVQYTVVCHCTRGMMSKDLHREIEFIVEVPQKDAIEPQPIPFTITPTSLENVKDSALTSIPDFEIKGRLNNTNCPITLPFTGEISIEKSDAPVRSVELQLVRVETVSHEDGNAREATEIQNIQIAFGDVCRKLAMPLYFIFPRLFTCPTMLTPGFKVEFEVNLLVIFQNGACFLMLRIADVLYPLLMLYANALYPHGLLAAGHMVTENFPITLVR